MAEIAGRDFADFRRGIDLAAQFGFTRRTVDIRGNYGWTAPGREPVSVIARIWLT